MMDTKWSPLYQIVNEEAERLHCRGHMCMSPWFQLDWNGVMMCNGCAGRVTDPIMELVTNDAIVAVYPGDVARELSEEEVGYSG